jgi:hypothetical protein
VPESAEKSAERKRRARIADRRRRAVNILNITEATSRYGASQLANGIGPAEARTLALELAAELTAAADSLRRLTRIGPAERRVLARQLAALGLGTLEISRQLGVSERCTRYYLTGKPGYASKG